MASRAQPSQNPLESTSVRVIFYDGWLDLAGEMVVSGGFLASRCFMLFAEVRISLSLFAGF